MRLQINLRGAWRDVLTYEAADDERARYHAAYLAAIARGKLRVLGDDGQPMAHWDSTNGWHAWVPPGERA